MVPYQVFFNLNSSILHKTAKIFPCSLFKTLPKDTKLYFFMVFFFYHSKAINSVNAVPTMLCILFLYFLGSHLVFNLVAGLTILIYFRHFYLALWSLPLRFPIYYFVHLLLLCANLRWFLFLLLVDFLWRWCGLATFWKLKFGDLLSKIIFYCALSDKLLGSSWINIQRLQLLASLYGLYHLFK